MLKTGHRGASGYLPENTIESFLKAVEMGCNAVELDIHKCKTGEIIVIHDETVDRTADGKGAVSEKDLDEIKSLSIDGRYKIPTLREVFDILPKNMVIFVEIKQKNIFTELLADIKYALEKGWNYSNIIVISFQIRELLEMRRLSKEVLLSITFDKLEKEKLEMVLGVIRPESVNLSIDKVSDSDVSYLKEKNIKIMFWTANKKAQIEKAKAYKPYAIASDYPNML